MMSVRRHVPAVLGGFLAVVAVLSGLSAISPVVRHLTADPRYVMELYVPAPENLAWAAFLGMIAAAMVRRKRAGWWFGAAMFGLFAVGAALFLGLAELEADEFDVLSEGALFGDWRIDFGVSLGLYVVTLAVLFWARREFYAKVQRASVWKALGVLVVSVAVGILLGWCLTGAFPGKVKRGDRFSYAAEHVLGGAFQFDATRPENERAPRPVNFALGLFGAAALVGSLYTLLRSQRTAAELTVEDELGVRRLLATYGERDSLGYFATRRDKSAIFAPNGKAAVTYRPVAAVSLASGDPIGDPDSWDGAIREWLARAREYSWIPAVMGASAEGAHAYRRAGLKVYEIGDEAIIGVRDFQLDGPDMRMVRQAVHRVERLGYTARIRRHRDIPDAEMEGIVALASKWRDTETERGFSMALSRLGDPADGDCVLVEVLDKQGNEAGLLSFSPWGRRGLSLDLMRRDRGSDNGLMEFMVTSLVRECGRLGVERISLNFAMFREVFEEGAQIGAGPVLRLWRRVLLFFSRWWQLESLYRSNLKYRPRWEPRFVCFGERRELPRVAIASAIAEGFLSVPSLRTLLARGRSARASAGAGQAGLAAPARPELVAELAREQPATEEAKLPEQFLVRRRKVERMRAEGIEPYPLGFDRTHEIGALRERHAGLAPDTHTGERVAIAGRVVLLREHGKLCFATVRDWSGDLQVMLTGPGLGSWKRDVDLGDLVGVTGEVITSRRGELSVLADSWQLTAKCLRPLPDKHRGLTDPEARVRARAVDLAINPDARELLRVRSAVVGSLRDSLRERGFLEVETPILQAVHGGANARPFLTHSNTYDLRLYLRIAPELYLKRLCVGGVEKVFELGRTFRNEGVSVKHNPEFTMLEAYQAYADYDDMLELARAMIRGAAVAAYGKAVLRRDGAEIDIGGEWPVRTVNEAVSAALGAPVTADTSVEELRRLADGISLDPQWTRGQVLLELYERLVEGATTEPTFYKDFPTDVSPLTRPHRADPRLAERWDLVAYGIELGTAYSELVDPIEQRRRLTAQSLAAAAGDPEAMELDEDFLTALEYAMPPSGGLGIGVDRLVMLLTGRSIRETLPFPLVRPS